MDHVAIMKLSWHLLPKILSGEKTLESRWYNTKHAPWDRIQPGETVYFKDSGKPVTIKATVQRVLQFDELTPEKVQELLAKHEKDAGIPQEKRALFYDFFKNKKYCILVFLKNPHAIQPFYINKKGFGMMSAWITVDSIDGIAKTTLF